MRNYCVNKTGNEQCLEKTKEKEEKEKQREKQKMEAGGLFWRRILLERAYAITHSNALFFSCMVRRSIGFLIMVK